MISAIRNKVLDFLGSSKQFPVIAAIAAGLYPLLYYYDKNFTLINSWSQFFFFLCFYLLIPIISFYLLYTVFIKIPPVHKYTKYLIPVLNLCLFVFLIVISTYGFNNKILTIALVCAFILAVLLKDHFKKIIILQFILSGLVFAKLVPDLFRHITYSSDWMEQADNIEGVVFKKKPNVYIIQADGYANFSELKEENYNFDNSDFESFLEEKDFKLYENYRSNYISTLSSNSSMFAMKHHYYNTPKPGLNELYNARDIIVGDNPVVSIFKKNSYKTFLLIETPYLLVNKPEIGYDYSNIGLEEVAYMANSKRKRRDLLKELEEMVPENKNSNNFYFIEKISPGHVSTFKSGSSGIDQERLEYIENLKNANNWLKDTIDYITKVDSNSLIVLVADHGGFVGLEYSMQSKEKLKEDHLVKSIFTSALAIRWPEQEPDFSNKLQTNVNLFRILFSYLSEDEKYLENLQEDKSYSVMEKGAPFGVYELINEKGEVVFNKFK
jgi:hypothetical protein